MKVSKKTQQSRTTSIVANNVCGKQQQTVTNNINICKHHKQWQKTSAEINNIKIGKQHQQ